MQIPRAAAAQEVVIRDHYAVLGVSPSSEDVVIHAAYRALMRQYHPDRNPSAHAAERVREITAAYEVLRDPGRRADYNAWRRAEREPPPPRRSGRGWMALAAAGVLGAASLLLVGGLPLADRAQSDRVPDLPVRPAAAVKGDAGDHCASDAATDMVKQELFRRAAQVRGGDGPAFDRIARHALLRVDSVAAADGDAAGTVGCSAFVALDLPPGVAAKGNRRFITADLAYSLSGDDAAPRLTALTGAEALVGTLAGLSSVPPTDQSDPAVTEPAVAEPLPTAPPAAKVAPSVPAPVLAERREAREAPSARPQPSVRREAPSPRANASFDCRFARTPGEIAVCKSENLAALDRHQAVLYSQSWALADAERRDQLIGTRGRFVSRRDSCRTEACIRSAYVDRLREISDIMARR